MPASSNKNTKNLLDLRPSTFVPTVIRGIVDKNSGDTVYRGQTIADFPSSSIGHSSSFRYDPLGSGLKSTQQLNVDWSSFANHTFFNSAQVKVNAAFDKFVNQYPFDGTREEVEVFKDKLTGWENYVFSLLPKNVGFQFFSGSTASAPNNGTYIEVKDLAGAAYKLLTKKPDGNPVLNPGLKSMVFEFHLFVPSGSNTEQVVFQKHNTTNDHGVSCFLLSTASSDLGAVHFVVASGSALMSASIQVQKGQWNHLAGIWNREPLVQQWQLYKSQSLYATSSKVEIGELNFSSANLYIGSGSNFSSYASTTTFSGAMDEFRIWHNLRSQRQLTEYANKNVFSEDNLMLYYKFNEPTTINTQVVIDGSGKGLHGNINSYGYNTLDIRNVSTASVVGSSPLLYEEMNLNPVLFPDFSISETLRQTLLTDAETYDNENPNLISKLIPRHYFLEGQNFSGLSTEEGDIVNTLVSGSTPNSSRMGGTQITLSLLYLMATFFDEMKLYLQNFANLNKVDYNNDDTVPDQFLQFLAERHGITLPPMFVGTSIAQYINAENYGSDYDTNNYSLQYIQNQIWRRVLINIKDVIASKGTLHSVKSFIRSVGIDPDNNFRIREYGGPTVRNLKVSRESRSEVAAVANFISGGFARSEYLSGARIEPGYPTPLGSFVSSNGVVVGTNQSSDGLFTSGSWTFEGTFIVTGSNAVTQSLARMHTTGSVGNNLYANLIAGGTSGSVTLYIRPSSDSSANTLTLNLTSSANIQTNEPWFISFGRQKGGEFGYVTPSSSYFLRAARQSFGEIVEEYYTSSFFFEGANDIQETKNASYNASGSFIEIGSSSIDTTIGRMLNSTTNIGDEARRTQFKGKVGNVRFWSKALELNEWREHVRNFKSLGVVDPKTNFNFATKESGSFERLRLDVSMDQATISSSAGGTITFNDFSQNNLNFSGSSFPFTSSVVVPQRYHYSMISPKFDVAATNNKVRARSFNNIENVMNGEEIYAQAAPVYELVKSEEPTDNTRFTIDYSIVDSLNQDIVGIFSTLDAFDNAIGEPALLFSPDYPSLENLRKIYFERLTDKINLKAFFEFYKWFDTNMGNFIHQLIPRKTRYNGINYVVESHMLERAKLQYMFQNNYLGDTTRDYRTSRIEILSLEGELRKK